MLQFVSHSGSSHMSVNLCGLILCFANFVVLPNPSWSQGKRHSKQRSYGNLSSAHSLSSSSSSSSPRGQYFSSCGTYRGSFRCLELFFNPRSDPCQSQERIMLFSLAVGRPRSPSVLSFLLKVVWTFSRVNHFLSFCRSRLVPRVSFLSSLIALLLSTLSVVVVRSCHRQRRQRQKKHEHSTFKRKRAQPLHAESIVRRRHAVIRCVWCASNCSWDVGK